MKNEITNEWVFDQSPAEVWEYLTQPDLIALWLMPNNFAPIVGQEFQFTVKPIPSLDLDGIMYCKVLEMVPGAKLSYSWKAGPGNGSFPLDTVVYWTLQKHGAGTKLLLKQTGFTEVNLAILNGMTQGWQTNVQKMLTRLNEIHHGNTNV